MKLKKFLFSRGPILSLIVAILFGVFVFMIYYSGYHAMPTNLDQLSVTVVNQDKASQKLQGQLKSALPFDHVKTTENLSQAKKDLNDRKTNFIVAIPDNFQANIKQNKSTALNFYINESMQTSVVSSMRTIAKTIGANVNQQVIVQKGQTMLTESQLGILQKSVATQKSALEKEVAAGKQTIAAAPAASQPALSAQLQQKTQAGTQKIQSTANTQESAIKQKVAQTYKPVSNSVKTKIHRVNKVKSGMNNSMAPFIANLAIYLGSLIGVLVLYGTYVKFAKQFGRFQSFGLLEVTMAILAIVSTSIVSASIVWSMGLAGSKFVGLWINHSLMLFAAYNLNAVLVLILGQVATTLNIFLTMIQVVAGAGTLPVASLNGFFTVAHYVSPIYYGVMSDFNTMYGGPSSTSLLLQLGLLIVGLIVVNLIIVTFRKKQPMLQLESLS
ncbi:YhgE/Pip domain-containing protein [Loigolactobacillus backii]|uniref:Uncharacterized protein n=1 Tax=Loigolactobacillus backii TaxID=375175 RepID=A0A192GZI1_9LACO|nr:ABC transporter permease [Loigolactobacillus backii]ANK61448.1 hypothetical protein AYR53_00940 [Loigolactobacillus backii]ANK69353.1 hypothetical protein AYR56_03775 [Loigolactobacillus backii]MDA5387789.1 ABC transporter permease [Loigolactobacillus backii]MDA5390881.1 ABC transporter permease [Loigolactobacillus backii]